MMGYYEPKELALALAYADTEEQVKQMLEEAGLWEDSPTNWKVIDEGHQNFSTIGNQQASADVALTEKIVNSVDAVMLSKCLEKGIDPESSEAPQSIAEAQKKFFDIYDGALSRVDSQQRSQLAEEILLVVTGTKKRPSYTIIDKGEGQSPNSFVNTFLSLNRGNKNKIKFVQGKFGMGGTGVLPFGSLNHNLQLVISKRNPNIKTEQPDDRWGVTIIRRRRPEADMRSSEYIYLAPKGEIISFHSNSLPLLPGAYPQAYKEKLEYGSFIKLYEYQIDDSLASHISQHFYHRLSLLLPRIALPVGLYERRKEFIGHSNEVVLSGLSVDLEESKKEDIEASTPLSGRFTIEGENIGYRIYVFHKGKRNSYTRNSGIIFTLDGKLHGAISQAFFKRKGVGMSYLADSILVIVDCSEISGRMREELFMNSRDRLRKTGKGRHIKDRLEEEISQNEGLKELREKRIRELSEKKLEETQPLEDVLQNMINKSISLQNLLSQGGKLRNPFDLDPNREREKFVGKEYPTYFKLAKGFSKDNPKRYPIDQKEFRVEYETDACNDYFDRDKDPGRFYFKLSNLMADSSTPSLYNGKAKLRVPMPESVRVGDTLYFESQLTDVTIPEPIVETFPIKIEQPVKTNPGGDDVDPPTPRPRKALGRLKLPEIISVEKKKWGEHGFNKMSALKTLYTSKEYHCYVNVDNIYLRTEIKKQPDKAVLLRDRFTLGMVIMGMSLLNFYRKQEEQEARLAQDDDEKISPEDKVAEFSKMIAPALLPMIEALGEVDIE